MSIATLRAVGGSVVMAIPKRILEMVNLHAGAKVDIAVQQGQLIVVPQRRPRFALRDLLAQCDAAVPIRDDEQDWLNAPAIGRENLAA